MWGKIIVGLLGLTLLSGGMVQAADDERRIVINIASRSLALYQGEEKIRLYPIATGSASTPTPTGYYKIQSKDINPTWTDPKDYNNVIPSGPSNPLGYRWMQIKGNYGIHGTNKPSSIGTFVSNGCIRMLEPDVEALFDMVKIGTPVEITYNRVVVEKTSEGEIAYYIYPDGYHRQPLTVMMVSQWLQGFGVSNFAADADIEAKIQASDGQPTYLGKPYKVTLQGKTLVNRAVEVAKVVYLPAQEIAETLKLNLRWVPKANTLLTVYGAAKGYDKKGTVYMTAGDLAGLFGLAGALTEGQEFALTPLAEASPTVADKTATKETIVQADIPAPAPINAPSVKPEVTSEPVAETKEILPEKIAATEAVPTSKVNTDPTKRLSRGGKLTIREE